MINSIATLYAQGLALSEIGDVLDVTRGKIAGAIHRVRKAGDVRFGPRSRPPEVKPLAQRRCRPRWSLSRRRSGSCWSTWQRTDAPIRLAVD